MKFSAEWAVRNEERRKCIRSVIYRVYARMLICDYTPPNILLKGGLEYIAELKKKYTGD